MRSTHNDFRGPMRKLCSWMLLLPFAAVLASCDNPAGGRGTGWMRASLSGQVSGEYSGDGDFLSQTDRLEGPRRQFSVISRSDPLASQAFDFYRHNGTRPSVGRYELELIDQTDLAAEGFYAFYHRQDGSTSESYAATSGHVEITASSAERVEGTFHFIGRRYCASPLVGNSAPPCSDPWAPPADAPTIEVTGDFVAVPMNTTVDY